MLATTNSNRFLPVKAIGNRSFCHRARDIASYSTRARSAPPHSATIW